MPGSAVTLSGAGPRSGQAIWACPLATRIRFDIQSPELATPLAFAVVRPPLAQRAQGPPEFVIRDLSPVKLQ